MEQPLNEAFLRAVRDRDVDRLEALLRGRPGPCQYACSRRSG